MYFDESKKLTERHLTDKDAIRMLDREIAHAYAPDGHGFTELPLLRHKSGLAQAEVERLMRLYEDAGVVASYVRGECPCGEKYDPQDSSCPSCGHPVADAVPDGVTCYRVLAQPREPAYNADAPPAEPDVFISYRHADSAKLAADIYYSLRAEGHSVFLDNGNIPVGADAERVYLNAASRAKYFVALVSKNYFGSDFCKKEIAHAARCRQRLIRVNVPPVPHPPNDMPWIDGPNWNSQQGDASGLTHALEQSLLTAVRLQPSPQTIADLRSEACEFLMKQMGFNDLEGLWNRLPWMRDIQLPDSKNRIINRIREETTAQSLQILCNALAP